MYPPRCEEEHPVSRLVWAVIALASGAAGPVLALAGY